METYLKLCRDVLEKGSLKSDRTGTGTLSYFGYQMRFNLQEGFPLLTTKKVHFHSVLGELLWFISGETNIRPLVMQKIRIWNEWPYEKYKKSSDYQGEDMDAYIKRIIEDEDFARKHGDLGPVYGAQWRNFNGVDQLLEIENEIKTNPHSRRLLISAWNPPKIKEMLLPPCHLLMQFYVSPDGETLSLQLYQRSADIFLGVPFNIASYSLLLHMMAHATGKKVGEFVMTIGDAHIYTNHFEQVKEQLTREPLPLPSIKIKRKVNSIIDIKYEDIELIDYNHHPAIKAIVSV
jgi:thymidylate synthase